MKKNYTTILTIFAFTAMVSAQTNIQFSDADGYDAATYPTITASLNDHPLWICETDQTAGQWKRDGVTEQIVTTASFERATYLTGFTASVGDVVSGTTYIRLGNDGQNYDVTVDRAMIFIGFKSTETNDNTGRAGVNVVTKPASGGTVDLTAIGAGTSPFNADPSISQANKNVYEVIVELTIGADAASTTIKSQIKNTNTAVTSAVGTTTGIDPVLYTEITSGGGAHYYVYALNYYTPAAGNTSPLINTLIINRVVLNVSTTPLLSTKEHNAFEFSMFPNPVKDKLYFNTREVISKVEAFDLQGRSVLTVDDVSDYIDVSSLSKAVYMLKLTSDNGVSTKKFIKQ
jgi:hypothetical protein